MTRKPSTPKSKTKPSKGRAPHGKAPSKSPDLKKVTPRSVMADAPTAKSKFDPTVRVIHTLQGALICNFEETAAGYALRRPALLSPQMHPAKDGRIIVDLRPVLFAPCIEVMRGTNTILGFSAPDPVLQVLYARFVESPEPVLTLETLDTALKTLTEKSEKKVEAQSDPLDKTSVVDQFVPSTDGRSVEVPAPDLGKVIGSVGPRSGERSTWNPLSAEVKADLLSWAGVLAEDQLSSFQLEALALSYTSGALKAWNCPDCRGRCYLGPCVEGIATLRNVNYAKYRGANIQPAEKARELCDNCRARFDSMDAAAHQAADKTPSA